jgi:hypothetical protein
MMKKVHCIAAVLGLGFALTPWAGAQAAATQPAAAPAAIPADQQPTKEQLAKLFEVMRLRAQMQNLMKALPSMIQEQIQAQAKEIAAKLPGGAATPEQQAAIEKVLNKYMEKSFNIYTADEMIEDMGSIYQRHLSRSDIDAFTAFYTSPAGQHLLDVTPVITREYMPLVMKRVQERSKVLTDELTKEMAAATATSTKPADKPAAK